MCAVRSKGVCKRFCIIGVKRVVTVIEGNVQSGAAVYPAIRLHDIVV